MALSNVKTTLKIRTVKGTQEETDDKGPLLLAAIQGIEGISMPFAYDLTLYQRLRDDDIDPRTMINTPATIGIRGESGSPLKNIPIISPFFNWIEAQKYTYRRGIFQSFEKDETNERRFEGGGQTDFRVYKARIVPAFKMMDYETRYRVFEDMTVYEIMEEVMHGFTNIGDIRTYVSDQYFKKDPFPKIPYCVQFGESSFNFLSRLMAQFNIWYFFAHADLNDDDPTDSQNNETMVLGNLGGNDDPMPIRDSPDDVATGGIKPCALKDMNVVFTPPEITDIAGFQRNFAPANKRAWVSNFNMLQPIIVPRGSEDVDTAYDLISEKDPAQYQREFFPATFDDPENTNKQMKEQAGDRMQDEEVDVFIAQGQCKNPTFIAGKYFHVANDQTKTQSKDKVGTPSNNYYLIRQLSFSAYEFAYGKYAGWDILNIIDSPVRWVVGLFRRENVKAGNEFDVTGALASAGLSSWVQGKQVSEIYSKEAFAKGSSQMGFLDTFAAGMNAAMWGSLAQLWFGAAIKETVAAHGDSYSNAFFAIPLDSTSYNLIPGPDAVKPRAYGPHLAVVVGPDGVYDASYFSIVNEMPWPNSDKIYADALGRVRVRFPWQREVQPSKGQNGQKGGSDPLKSDRRTCWVPVSEGWAGNRFGTQFLPRIGQEVLVSFIDGDPDRPIITGRVYHADTHDTTNLPFPPKEQAQTPFKEVTDLPKTARKDDFRFSGIETRSFPMPRDSDGNPTGTTRYHLMRFDDMYNKEQYLIRSQGRLDITAYNHRYETISRDRNLTVGGKKITPSPKEIGGDYITKIFRHYYLHVGDPEFPTQSGNRVTKLEQNDELFVKKNSQLDSGTYSAVTGNYYLHVSGRPDSGGGKRDTIVDQNDSLLVKADLNQMISGNWSTALAKQMSVRSDTTIVLEAFTNISFVVGGSSIVITPSSIAINSPMVLINSGGPPPASPIVPPAPPINDPSIPEPQTPTPADPGSSLDPPKWQD
jgi:uncharacterized protein involved in type VI secretion and phage assembly